ncbi:predicted protein [Sclerotinia sclerotiorum 1980 UF-70]|uniref:Uncharacterized protein n=1 Tax=Sclerotinia sclerotiorum (strain ATCC 18683 / 1980 / Ss-1) TaxID=665079 RepID=A7EXA7_SCLS1|nr:predicted protein [Sclerotinia sclerotiorum 1980 UF-70]EDN94099.1 predicted protein [Sclerotinia sclerotiorum 1980 UF-70]
MTGSKGTPLISQSVLTILFFLPPLIIIKLDSDEGNQGILDRELDRRHVEYEKACL